MGETFKDSRVGEMDEKKKEKKQLRIKKKRKADASNQWCQRGMQIATKSAQGNKDNA